VWAEHGRLPVPVPAVVKLWESRQVPIYSNGIDRELVTPTGAAIAVTLAESFGQAPGMTLHKIGLGAGSHDLSTPNILRLWLGDLTVTSESDRPSLGTQETIMVLETHCDDLNPQAIGYLFEQLLAAGALDVFTTAIGMKKSRPGILLTVLCHPAQMSSCHQILFQETTTLGIRVSQQTRTILARQFHRVTTPYGEVTIKCAYDHQGNLYNLHPEFEDCATLARQSHQPWQVIYQAAIAAILEQQKTT
ncbi:MAG: nickel pincer cofactor biosynthesis protein LarC, partial [Microcystaceae cyanobacterium]